jgi:hypothetical protein
MLIRPIQASAFDAGWSSLVARRAHNPKVAGSNPAPATFLNNVRQANLRRQSAHGRHACWQRVSKTARGKRQPQPITPEESRAAFAAARAEIVSSPYFSLRPFSSEAAQMSR